MQAIKAVVLGASGLIGHQLVQLLLQDNHYSEVNILVRRHVQLQHPKLKAQVVNFDDTADFRHKLGAPDCIFCCIGTTMKKVKGDKKLYRKIDYDIPVKAARMALDAGATNFVLVSSVGANKKASSFYLQLKGAVEETISSMSYKSVHIFRPSILFGDRKENRTGETVAQFFMKMIGGLLRGSWKKYRGVDSRVVAKAMVVAGKDVSSGVQVHHYTNLMQLAKS